MAGTSATAIAFVERVDQGGWAAMLSPVTICAGWGQPAAMAASGTSGKVRYQGRPVLLARPR